MGWAAGAMMAAGATLDLGGALMQGGAANRRRKAMQKIANTPGLDTNLSTREALGWMNENFDAASALGQRVDTYNQGQVDSSLNAAIPGYQEIQRTRSDMALDFLKGEIPKDVQEAVARSAAARALGGGYGGSGAHRNLVARDLGLTSLDLMGKGQQYSSNIISSTPRATPVDIGRLLGPDPMTLAAIRDRERTMRINQLLGVRQMPGSSEITAGHIRGVGGALLGAGTSMMSMGMGGGGGGGGGAGSNEIHTSDYESWNSMFQ